MLTLIEYSFNPFHILCSDLRHARSPPPAIRLACLQNCVVVNSTVIKDESLFVLHTAPTCSIPTIEYGSLSCKTASGLQTETPGDGDVCSLSCDAGRFVVEKVNPVCTCNVSGGGGAQFDVVPSCSEFD